MLGDLKRGDSIYLIFKQTKNVFKSEIVKILKHKKYFYSVLVEIRIVKRILLDMNQAWKRNG